VEVKGAFLRKVVLNLGPRALAVLGPVTYLRYLAACLRCLGGIVRARNFLALDRAMGTRALRLRRGRHRFTIDCRRTDELIRDGTYTFGIIRELVIRNCYTRGRIGPVADTAATVLDLGANRGVFSAMMATTAKRVIAVEALAEYARSIEVNMRANGFTNYAVEVAFVGEGGIFDDRKQATISMGELMDKYGLESVDLVKMDIEGSEYSVFRDADWLDRVSAICMEVHPEWGDVREILDVLARRGFAFDLTDHAFRPTEDPQQGEFIYAVRTRPPAP
jgi:hypothetical protein